MTLADMVSALATRVGVEVKAVRAELASAIAGVGTTANTPNTVVKRDASGIIQADMLRLYGAGDASATSTTHPFQIGSSTSVNVIIDNNEVIARNNGVLASLGFNSPVGFSTAPVTVPNPTANGQAEQHQDTGWINLTPTSPATAFATGTMRYRVVNGICYVSVAAVAPSGWTTASFNVATLPAAGRPSGSIYVAGMFAGYQGVQITIAADGTMRISNTMSGTSISLIFSAAFPVGT